MRFNAWDKNAQLDSEGNVAMGKLWATVSYNPNTAELRETRDGKRWPNEYRDEFTYRDLDGASMDDYWQRVEYYRSRGYTLVGDVTA